MYRLILLSSIVLLFGNIYGQDIPPSLSEKIELMGMAYTPSEKYSVTYWEHNFGAYACEDKDCPLRRLQLMDAKMTHVDNQCKIFILAIAAEDIRYFGVDRNNRIPKRHPSNYSRIKTDLMRGPHGAATKQEVKDFDMMLTYYPQDSAKSCFNADYMVCYPYLMDGKKCVGRFSCGRTILIGRGGLDIHIYFFLTEEAADNFDKYLSDFKKVLWFKE
ncbi:MAG: hypothetical protein LBT43_14225 [Prevotella sp.]|jgi:hypothetical protein|nr:hypothetical protein [Prevotella sp.]